MLLRQARITDMKTIYKIYLCILFCLLVCFIAWHVPLNHNLYFVFHGQLGPAAAGLCVGALPGSNK